MRRRDLYSCRETCLLPVIERVFDLVYSILRFFAYLLTERLPADVVLLFQPLQVELPFLGLDSDVVADFDEMIIVLGNVVGHRVE